MASKNSAKWLLVTLWMGTLWVMYGCGGGSGGGDATFNPLGPAGISATISGQVTASGTIANLLREPASVAADVRAAAFPITGARVWIESAYDTIYTTTDALGRFTLVNVPFGTHRIVASRQSSTGVVYKYRSQLITTSDLYSNIANINLEIVPASNYVTGRLTNNAGQGIPNARMLLWGEPFFSDATGAFASPRMPDYVYTESISVTNTGAYTPIVFTTPFTTTPQNLAISLAQAGENRAPIVTLTAGKVLVQPNESYILINASATDPDGQRLSYTWSWTDGQLATFSSDAQARWTAPGVNGLATVTLTVTDGSLTGRAQLGFIVGGGSGSTNQAPTATLIGSGVAVIGQTIDLRVDASDPNYDPVTYSWSATPATGNFSSTTGATTRWTAPGTVGDVLINCRVSDGRGGTTDVNISVRVWDGVHPPANRAPVVTIAAPVGQAYTSGGRMLFAATSSIRLDGSALDPDQGAIPNTNADFYNNYRWFIGGQQVATGPSKYFANLAPGTTTITLQVYDYPAAPTVAVAGTASVVLRVNTPPMITALTANPSRPDYPQNQMITFTATVSDPDVEDNPVADSRFTWTLDGAPIATHAAVLTINPTAPGPHYLAVRYYDHTPYGVTTTSNITYSVATNTVPVMQITNVQPNQASYARGTAITFGGSGTDWEDGAFFTVARYVWTIDGVPFAQGVNQVTISTLTPGIRSVGLVGYDSHGASGTTIATVTIEANVAPQMQIVSVTPNQPSYPMGMLISFVGAGTDIEDGGAFTPASFAWLIDGVEAARGTTAFAVASLTPGVRIVSLQGYDSFGGIGLASASITIQPNAAPAMTITAPVSGGSYPFGTTINFTSTGTDVEDGGAFTAASFTWFDNGNQFAAATANPSYQFATSGAHVITLRGTDSQNAVGQATLTLTIGTNNAPAMSIAAPTPANRVVPIGTIMNFAGLGTDAEDGGSFTAASFTWLDGTNPFAIGLANPSLLGSLGTHTIWLRGTDRWGAVGEASITVIFNATPAVAMATTRQGSIPWASGALFLPGEQALFAGSATDPNDGTLTGNSLRWFEINLSNPALRTQIATGGSFNPTFQTTDYGWHKYEFEAIDQYGYTAATQTMFVVDRRPTGKITPPTGAYATATGRIPVFLAGPNPKWLNFTCLATDADEIPDIPAASITWYLTSPGVPEYQVATATLNYNLNIGETFPAGTSTFRIHFYDSLGVANDATCSLRVWKYDEFDADSRNIITNLWSIDPAKRFTPAIASVSGLAVSGSDFFLADPVTPQLWKFNFNDGGAGGVTLLTAAASCTASSVVTVTTPRDIGASGGGVWTIDQGQSRVYEFKTDLSTITSALNLASRLINPADAAGIAVTANNQNVSLLDRSGRAVMFNGGSDVTGMSAPRGITAQGERIFIANTGANEIRRYDRTLSTTFTSFGSPGTGNGQFNSPRAIEFVQTGALEVVYVVDYDNRRIQAFDVNGNFLMTFGSSGTGHGQFTNPVAMTVDSNHTVVVADYDGSNNLRIMRFRTGPAGAGGP